MTVMPEFEKTDFMCRNTEERSDRMAKLRELLEQAKAANLERDRATGRIWDPALR